MPADAARLFRRLGYQCWHVSELGMQRAEDEDILGFAKDRGCVVIPLDADFHALVSVRGLTAPSVIRLRRERCRAEAAVAILGPVLERYGKDLEAGVLISVKERRVTHHLLPVGNGL